MIRWKWTYPAILVLFFLPLICSCAHSSKKNKTIKTEQALDEALGVDYSPSAATEKAKQTQKRRIDEQSTINQLRRQNEEDMQVIQRSIAEDEILERRLDP